VASSVPSVVPAYVTLLQGALPATAQVVLGSVFPVFVGAQAVIITDVHFTYDEYAELGPLYRHEEHYTLKCCLYNTGGLFQDLPDIQALTVATYALYSDVSTAVANNPTLGLNLGASGFFRMAWPRQLDFCPDFDIKGMANGRLEFEVDCQARMQSLV
jgi:hypothetical protein